MVSNLAYMELYLIVAYLVRRFAFQTGTTEADMQIWLSRGSMASFDERVLDYTSRASLTGGRLARPMSAAREQGD